MSSHSPIKLNFHFGHRWQIRSDANGDGDYIPCVEGRITAERGEWLAFVCPPGELARAVASLNFVKVRSDGPAGLHVSFLAHQIHALCRGGVQPLELARR